MRVFHEPDGVQESRQLRNTKQQNPRLTGYLDLLNAFLSYGKTDSVRCTVHTEGQLENTKNYVINKCYYF